MGEGTRVLGSERAAATDLDFASFYASESLRLGRALYLLTGDASEAEELAQEALVRVYERWGRVRAMASPTGYLFRVAINLHRSRVRLVLVRARRALAPAPSIDPAALAEVNDELGRALASLPIRLREAVVLVEWMGLDMKEAARILGIEAVSVRVRLSRARASLREHLRGDDDDA
jgi:RNA polymerase sigma factor (sigma-70 family)